MNGQARYIPVESPFRLAVMNCHYIKFPLTCFLDAAKRFGFREIELFGAMPHFFLDDDKISMRSQSADAPSEC